MLSLYSDMESVNWSELLMLRELSISLFRSSFECLFTLNIGLGDLSASFCALIMALCFIHRSFRPSILTGGWSDAMTSLLSLRFFLLGVSNRKDVLRPVRDLGDVADSLVGESCFLGGVRFKAPTGRGTRSMTGFDSWTVSWLELDETVS